ncbi:MAG: site-2 protease family protein [Planctomycetota bacterium]|jgi:Zn-dependent protease
MSWQDSDEWADDDPMRRLGRPGGDWRGLRPSLDNPMTWSVLIGRVLAIDVRVHLLFLVFIVIELLRPVFGATGLGFGPSVLMLGCLFGVVFVHEIGHCLACRGTGGQADEILMWPLGGLAYCRPRNLWRAHLVTAAGGPAVNVLLLSVLTPALGILTGRWWGVALANPLRLFVPLEVSGSWILMTLFFLNAVSLILLLFNLLPIFPLDGGRIAQALLWPKLGYARSMRMAVRAGYVGAIALGIAGFVLPSVMLVCIAVFGGITCWITHKQLQFTQDMMGFETEQEPSHPGPSPREIRRAERRARREQDEQQRVDAILQKIRDSGIDSLTAAEKRQLRRETRRKQQSQ